MKTAFLKTPITLVRGRYLEVPFYFYETYDKKLNTGTLQDLDGYTFLADFRYDVDDTNPVFTLEGPASPADIIVEDGIVTLVFSETNTALVEVSRSNNDFPFTRLFFELKVTNGEGKKISSLLGTCNVYENVTRSDDGI